MNSYNLEVIRTLTPWLFAIGSALWVLVAFVINKVFARKSDVDALQTSHNQLQREVAELPKQKDISKIFVALETINGDIKEVKTSIDGLERMSHLLLENELKGEQ